MPTQTRRGLLAALTGIAGGLAGCAGRETASSRSEANRRTVPEGNAATNPPMLRRRSTAAQPPMQLRDEHAQAAHAKQDADGSPYRFGHNTNEIIDTAAKADRLVSNADAVEANSQSRTTKPGADSDLAAFISATDLTSETLYLDTQRVKQCYRLSLCYVSWQETEIRTAYGRRLRPYDEACAADQEVTEARLIRLPVALTADSVTSVGTSTRSARCRRVIETELNRSSVRNGTSTDTSATHEGST